MEWPQAPNSSCLPPKWWLGHRRGGNWLVLLVLLRQIRSSLYAMSMLYQRAQLPWLKKVKLRCIYWYFRVDLSTVGWADLFHVCPKKSYICDILPDRCGEWTKQDLLDLLVLCLKIVLEPLATLYILVVLQQKKTWMVPNTWGRSEMELHWEKWSYLPMTDAVKNLVNSAV
ncbi:hypothetical protein ACP70R_038774 [Stipagrostis hirtigluma subsp. patula]